MYTMKKVNTLGVYKANFQPPGVTSSTYCTSKPSSFKEGRRANIRPVNDSAATFFCLMAWIFIPA